MPKTAKPTSPAPAPAVVAPTPGATTTTATAVLALPQAGPPPVRLIAARVRDFRGIEDCTLTFDESTVLLGENNVGKSAILEALDIALGDRHAAISDLRARADGTTASRFVVDLELTPWGANAFSQDAIDLLGLALRPEPGTGRQRYFIRVVGEPDDTNRTIKLARGFVDSWSAATDQGFLAELTQVQRRALWYSLVNAQRDLISDLRSRSSPWGKLLRRLKLDEPARKALEAQLATLSTQVLTGLPDAAKLEAAVAQVQSVMSGQVSSARLAMLPKALNDLWRTADLLIQAPGHAELSIGQQGMGARSLASLLSFRAWLEAEMAVAAEPPLMVVTAFEEPEAHLHPQAQRATLAEVSKVPGQRILSTHSPYIASAAGLDSFRVIHRSKAVQVHSTSGISTDPSLDPDGLENIHRFCLHRNGDMLFARLVILGEGDTDTRVLPELARTWWKSSAEERGVSIVPTDGVGNMRTFATFLERLGIPWVALLDGDAAGKAELELMKKVPLLAPLINDRVVLVHNKGTHVDIEDLLASTGFAACIRAISNGNAQWEAALAKEAPAAIAEKLRSQKGTLARRVGIELGKTWATAGALPDALKDIFTKADALLK